MKRKNMYVLCFVFLLFLTGCTDHYIGIYDCDYVIYNDLHSTVNIRLWKYGQIRENKKLAPGDAFQYSIYDSEGGLFDPFIDFDSIQVTFSNNTNKTDINCDMLRYYCGSDSINIATSILKCREDTITMYDKKYHEISEVKKKYYKYLYRINTKDSLEAK